MFLPKFKGAIFFTCRTENELLYDLLQWRGPLVFLIRMRRALVFLLRIKSKAPLFFCFEVYLTTVRAYYLFYRDCIKNSFRVAIDNSVGILRNL